MIVVATSGANHCLYCVVAHGALLRIYEKKPLLADQVAVNHRKADITPRQKRDARLRDQGLHCDSHRGRRRRLRGRCASTASPTTTPGTSPRIAALFGLSNRIANVTSMRPNDEFYLMGRVPRLSVAKRARCRMRTSISAAARPRAIRTGAAGWRASTGVRCAATMASRSAPRT